MAEQRQRLIGIQCARGFAAILVVFYHASRMVDLPQYAGTVAFGGALQFGHAGVDFFFVLSGFIIYFVHRRDLGFSNRFLKYAWRRVSRIYPSYWLVSAVAIAILIAKGDPLLTPLHLVKSLLLIPDNREPYLDVAWTLVHEMYFYLIFGVAILNLRAGIILSCAVIALTFWQPKNAGPEINFMAAYRNLEFIAGILAAIIVIRVRTRHGILIAAVGFCGFLATGFCENFRIIPWDSGLSGTLFSIAFVALIIGIAAAEREGSLRMGSAAEFFGGLSYLLYLVHILITGLTFRALEAVHLIKIVPGEFVVVIAAVNSIITAGLLYRYFEQPIQRYFRGLGTPALLRTT